MAGSDIRISEAQGKFEMGVTADLFRAYAASLSIDLAFQGFEDELLELPGKYGPPTGVILLAWSQDNSPLGCVALRALGDGGKCEMKRMYVKPEARGLGLGRKLAESIIGQARTYGYTEMWLDTIPELETAVKLYLTLGFKPAPRYNDSPSDTLYFCKVL